MMQQLFLWFLASLSLLFLCASPFLVARLFGQICSNVLLSGSLRSDAKELQKERTELKLPEQQEK
jgi:hypothetical protein